MDANLPKLVNPMQDLMMGMPMLPQIVQSAMPVVIPQMNYDDNVVKMIFGNFKRTRISKAAALEADIAESANRALTAKLNSMHQVFTFSAKTADTLGQYEHNKTMRMLDEREKLSDIYIKEAQASTAGYEAKLAELDFKIRMNQFNKMEDAG